VSAVKVARVAPEKRAVVAWWASTSSSSVNWTLDNAPWTSSEAASLHKL
jgi:hypothetical protein